MDNPRLPAIRLTLLSFRWAMHRHTLGFTHLQEEEEGEMTKAVHKLCHGQLSHYGNTTNSSAALLVPLDGTPDELPSGSDKVK